MQIDQALQLIGLDEGASAEQIAVAFEVKQKQVEGLLEKAPTDGLKEKYQKMLAQIDEAKQPLDRHANARDDDTSSVTASTARQSSSPLSQSSLSQSKFEDLPSAQARHSQFEEQAKAELSLEEGQVLAGRYKIEEKIAAGGMGVVYRAFDQNRNEDIAIKVMLPSLVKNPRAREKFMDEARLSSKLSHPNIVNVYDVQNEGELYFLTMELLEGQDLRDVMENRKLTRQPFTKDEVIDLLKQVTAGLNHAHETTVHRDLKPENIYLTEDGEYKVMDFGIARVQSTSQRTQSGVVSGTAYYMAPEQVKGAKGVDARADQYAMAVFTYELLCGDVPTGMITPLHELRSDIGRGFSKAIEKALANQPEGRHENLNQFILSLEKSGSGFNLPNFSVDTEKLAIPALVLLAVVIFGGIIAGGAVDFGSVFMSKSEIAQRKGDSAKLIGEIKVIKKRLDSSARNLESDVKDAERNNARNTKALRHWERIAKSSVLESARFTDLEGELAMAEVLLREGDYNGSEKTLQEVKLGFTSLYDNFNAAGELYSYVDLVNTSSARYNKAFNDANFGRTVKAKSAIADINKANDLEAQGDILQALSLRKSSIAALNEGKNIISKLLSENSNAERSRRKYINIRDSKKYGDVKVAVTAQSYFDKAVTLQKKGSLVEALSNLKLSEEGYLAAYQEVKSAAGKGSDVKSLYRKYQAILAYDDYGVSAKGKVISKDYIKAISLEKTGKTTEATQLWSALEKVLSKEYSSLKDVRADNKKLSSIQATWVKTKSNYGILTSDNEKNAAQLTKKAKSSLLKGDYSAAKAQISTAMDAWKKTRESFTRDIARIDGQRQDANNKRRRAAADEAVWAIASKTDSVLSYNNYLSSNINTKYRTTANERINKLNSVINKTISEFHSDMVSIKGGSFTLGGHRHSDTKLSLKVTLPAFKMSAFEVTNEKWGACVKAGRCNKKEAGDSRGKQPVVGVSQNEIIRNFLPWLRGVSGRNYRLPTEAEWEYVAENGRSKFSSIQCSADKFYSNQCPRKYSSAEVGYGVPNSLGIYNMIGNVREILADTFCTYIYYPKNGKVNDSCPGIRMYRETTFGYEPAGWGSNRELNNAVIRGYSFSDFTSRPGEYFFERNHINKSKTYDDLGFRLALD